MTDFHGDQAKIFIFFEEKENPKWPTQKNLILPNGQFSIFFCQIEAVRLSDIRPKTGKKLIFGVF